MGGGLFHYLLNNATGNPQVFFIPATRGYSFALRVHDVCTVGIAIGNSNPELAVAPLLYCSNT
jgi:hypothetical protein